MDNRRNNPLVYPRRRRSKEDNRMHYTIGGSILKNLDNPFGLGLGSNTHEGRDYHGHI